MTRFVVVWGAAALALIAEGAVGDWLPAAWCPDVGLLIAVALGLALPRATGLAMAWAIGWTEDLLSAAPLGQYALLRLLAWGATRAADRSIHLRHSALLIGFVAVLTVADALVLLGVSKSFGIMGQVDPTLFALLVPRALVNAIAVALVRRAVTWGLGDRWERTAARAALRLEPRPPGL